LFECFKGKITVNLFANSQKWYKKLLIFLKLQYYARVNGITHLVVNTLDSSFGSLIVKSLSNVYKVGIVHRVQDIKSKRTYFANVSRMDGVLTLSDHTFEFLVANYKWVKNPSYFYPVFFCQEPSNHKASGNEIRIIIPGQLSNERRDYRGLLAALRQLASRRLPVKFFLLGDARRFDGPSIVAEVRNNGLEEYFYFSEGFVPYVEFIRIISEADYVMPLLSTDQENSQYYMESQISAATNWALGFRKPILLHESFKDLKYISVNALYYHSGDLPAVLSALSKSSGFKEIPDLAFANQVGSYFKSFDEQ
jgi:hypothetical protein